MATHDTAEGRDTMRAVVSLDTAATIAGCSRRTLQRAIQRGELDRIEVDGRAVLNRATLDAWAATRDTRHVAGVTHPRHATDDGPRHVAPTAEDRGGRIAVLEIEIAALRDRVIYAERVAADRQRTIDSLAGSVARLAAIIDTGGVPAAIAGNPSPATIEHRAPMVQTDRATAPDGAASDLQGRSATHPPFVGQDTMQTPPSGIVRRVRRWRPRWMR